MDQSRRTALKAGGGAGVLALLFAAGIVRPGEILAQDWNQAAFSMKTVPEAMRALGAQDPAASDAIQIKAPEIAENGAVVPIAIESRLPGTESITLLIEKNPQPLAASFTIPAGTEPNISTRVKVGESSDVYALVKADGKFYVAKKEIKITLGGCGG
ncbi:MAG TPA: thiosulfate oxidation carrier protein SoxY [Burkholderiales bacterium]|nr:thiosulfate oxidation carrier protein SoxY [Burkholderiales bacterium]